MKRVHGAPREGCPLVVRMWVKMDDEEVWGRGEGEESVEELPVYVRYEVSGEEEGDVEESAEAPPSYDEVVVMEPEYV